MDENKVGRDHSGGISFVALRGVTFRGVCYFGMKFGGYRERWDLGCKR